MTSAITPDLLIAKRASHIQRTIDNTALAAYMRCPREFLYSMLLHRRKKGTPRPALAFGTTWHAILQEHYRTGGDTAAVQRAGIMSWEQHEDPTDHRTVERALSCYDEYIKKWGDHAAEAKAWGATLGWPEMPVVEEPTELWWEGAAHPYAGKIDRIVVTQGMHIVEDHKTTSALGKTYFRQFDPSNQMMGYAWLAQILTGAPIAGVRINALGVLKTESKFERQTILFTQDRLIDWTHAYNHWIERINNAIKVAIGNEPPKDEAEMVARLKAASQEDIDRAFPYNFNACAGKYGPCSYVEVDTMPVKIRTRVLENDFDYAPWNPLAEEGEEAA